MFKLPIAPHITLSHKRIRENGKTKFRLEIVWPLVQTLRIEKKTIDILQQFVILQQFFFEAVTIE